MKVRQCIQSITLRNQQIKTETVLKTGKQYSSIPAMRLLIYSDLQATDGSELCFNQPGLTLQHYRTKRFFDDLARLYVKHACDGVVDLGDTTDDRAAIPMPTLEVLGAGIAKLPDGSHWKLTGNHEQFLRDTSVNNRRLFEHRFNVVDNREIKLLDGLYMFFASYPANHLELAEWLLKETRHIRGPKVLFGHFQVEGAFFNNSTALTGVPKSVLSKFDLVLLGHIHIPQAVTPKIHYVGSPFQQDWGEANQAKRVGIVDTHTLTVEWIPLTGYPEYRAVTLAEFNAIAEDTTEHRYRVTLNNHAEAEQYFRHPHFRRASADYNYDETPAEPLVETQDWTFEGMCRRYLKLMPPANTGIEFSTEEMLDVTAQIIKG